MLEYGVRRSYLSSEAHNPEIVSHMGVDFELAHQHCEFLNRVLPHYMNHDVVVREISEWRELRP